LLYNPQTMVLRCDLHHGYRSARPPKTDCITCWAVYGRRRALDDGLRSRGRAKGGGQSSKAKGRSAVLLVVATLRHALGLEEGDVFVKATSQGGCDVHLSPAALARFPFSIEIKNDEHLRVWAALRQAELNARPGRPPILFFKRAGSLLFVALSAADFLRLLPCPEPKP
jgi:hypothetical protein